MKCWLWVLIVIGEKFFGNEVALVGKNGLLGRGACEPICGVQFLLPITKVPPEKVTPFSSTVQNL